MKRLIRKSKHGIDNRDEAILYINGEVTQGYCHPDLINYYLSKHYKDLEDVIKNWFNKNKPNTRKEDINSVIENAKKHGELPYYMSEELTEWQRINTNSKFIDVPIAFAHYIKENEKEEIYIEQNSLMNVTMETVVNAIKNKYPNAEIYNDDAEDSNGNYLKIARLKRVANAYDWVSERAKHIRKNNPDMDEGMEYGISWKQYKKEHPKWRNKKEKSKQKK